jgi:hypothetical protein
VLIRMCLADAECTREYTDVIQMVASRWDELTLPERMDEWSAQIDEGFWLDERHTGTKEQVLESRARRRAFVEGRAQSLFDVLAPL